MNELERPNKKQLAILTVLLGVAAVVFYFLIPTASAAITTTSATVDSGNATWCVWFIGSNSGAAENVWFEYAGAGSTGYTWKTPNQSKTGAFSAQVCDMPFMSGKSYYVRAAGQSGVGGNETFIFPAVTPIPTLTYSTYVDSFLASNNDPKELIRLVFTPYTAALGGIFFGLLVFGIFVNMAMKEKTVWMTIIMMLITGGLVWTLFPDYPEFIWLAQTLFIAAVMGMIYWMFKKRRR